MIKSNKINDIIVKPFWNHGNGVKKSVKESHEEISHEPFLNIICCARKKSGKTTVALYLLKHFMTNKTKLVIFSPDILNDSDNVNALKLIIKKFGEDSITLHDKFINDKGVNVFIQEVDDASDRFQLENNSKYEYPRSIFIFDDLGEDDLKSKEIGEFFQKNRHYGTLNIISSQDYINFAPGIRKNCDIMMMWQSIPKERLKLIYDTIQPGVKLDDFTKLYNYAVGGNSRNFLYVDVPNKIFRKNFNEELYIKNI